MRLVLTNCTLCSGEENAELVKNVDLYVDGETIAAIANRGEERLPGYEEMDLTGKFVVPGLIDAHAHLTEGPHSQREAEASLSPWQRRIRRTKLWRARALRGIRKRLKEALYSGVTAMRTLGDPEGLDLAARELVRSGKALGPRLLVSGPAIEAGELHTADELASLASRRGEEGADLVSLGVTDGLREGVDPGQPGRVRLTEEAVRSVCAAAHFRGMRVAARAESPEGIRLALAGGADSIEHGGDLTDDVIAELLSRRVPVVASLSPLVPPARLKPDQSGLSALEQFNAEAALDRAAGCARSALEHGIPLGLGSDAPKAWCGHGDMWRELDWLMRLVHVSGSAALTCATLQNARILGIAQQTGSLAPGKDADLLVLDDNPLEDPSALSRPRIVFLRGQLIRPRRRRKEPRDRLADSISL